MKEEDYWTLRKKVGVVDLSEDVKIRINGSKAENFLNTLLPSNVEIMSIGKIINTAFCKEDGSIIAIIWLLREDENTFWIFSDKEKKDEIWYWFQKNLPSQINIEDITYNYKCFSIIGPYAQRLCEFLISEDILAIPYLSFEKISKNNLEILVCRVGYTGEFEYRFFIPANLKANDFWKDILERGKEFDIKDFKNKNVLDILTLEMKSINHLKDLKKTTTLIEAGLHWMIDFKKEKFIGKERLFQQLESNNYPKACLGIIEEEKVENFISEEAGEIVNKGYSYWLKKEIGIAYVKNNYAVVGVKFLTETNKIFTIVSAPLFITETVKIAREGGV